MKQDIILNGVSIAELKKQKAAIQKDAAKLIADSIQAATNIVGEIMKATSKEQANNLAQEAYDHLETAEVVSGVSGVEYYLEYDYEYGEREEILSYKLNQEDIDEDDVNPNIEFSWREKGPLYSLYSKLERMESTSRDWNTSTC